MSVRKIYTGAAHDAVTDALLEIGCVSAFRIGDEVRVAECHAEKATQWLVDNGYRRAAAVKQPPAVRQPELMTQCGLFSEGVN